MKTNAFLRTLAVMTIFLCVLCVCVSAQAEAVATVEAEDGVMLGGTSVKQSPSMQWVEGFQKEGDGVCVTLSAPEAGFYDIVVRSATTGGHKENYVEVDGQSIGVIVNESAFFEEPCVEYVYLDAGEHEIAVKSYWGWIKVDSFSLRPSETLPEDIYQVEPTLVNPNADDNAKRVMRYLCDMYGKQMLSGQYCDTGMNGKEITAIRKATGCDAPAVLGLDMIELTPSRAANGSKSNVIRYAKEQWEAGGLVTFCWHWNVPEKYFGDIWWKCFYTESVTIDLGKIMSGEDPEGYDLLMRDIDMIAGYLKELQDAGVPVLWRPLHEASGGWFWWGASGPEPYKQLYRVMYDKLTNEHGLNNLIWVWNGQSADWYPGDEYVDIIGEDIYAGNRVYTSQAAKFIELNRYTDVRKLIVLSENGCVIDPELAVRDNIMWGFFCTWQGEFISRNGSTLSGEYNDKDMLQKVYGSDAVITLSELPDLKSYPLD